LRRSRTSCNEIAHYRFAHASHDQILIHIQRGLGSEVLDPCIPDFSEIVKTN